MSNELGISDGSSDASLAVFVPYAASFGSSLEG